MVELQEVLPYLETVSPGQAVSFTTACVPGDCIDQGDLRLVVINKIPAGWKKVASPFSKDLQLVLGNTKGARHCLDSFKGVKLFHPENWTEESLYGPCLIFSEERKILHPVHGGVTVPAGLSILCRYQREYDKELAKERRVRD